MPTTLTKPVIRELPARNDAARPVVVTIDRRGITLRGKGTKRSLFVGWDEAARSADLHAANIPATWTYDPIRWLEE